jgi:CBS domain-containing protein
MTCPACGYDNIPGDDECTKCGAALTGLDVATSGVERSIERHSVSAIATKDPLTVPGFTTVRAAIRQMVAAKVGCVLVEEEGRVVGIFTERDVLNRVTVDRAALDEPVSRHMTATPQMIDADDSIAYALHLMSVGGYRHLPVADAEGRAASIVSARDMLRFLAIRFAAIREPR